MSDFENPNPEEGAGPGWAAPPPPPEQPSGVPPYVQPGMQHGYPGGPQPSNGLAIAGLVLGIVGVVLCWIPFLGVLLGVLAIVFGALGKKKANQGAQGSGQAVAGLVLGIIATALAVLITILVVVEADKNDDGFDDFERELERELDEIERNNPD